MKGEFKWGSEQMFDFHRSDGVSVAHGEEDTLVHTHWEI